MLQDYYGSQKFIDIYNQLKHQIENGKWRNYSLNNYLQFRVIQKGNDQPTATAITLSVANINPRTGNRINYVVDYEADFVPVPGHPNQLQIFLKDPNLANGWWQYFPYLSPILEEVVNNAPYEISDSFDSYYYQLTSVKDRNFFISLSK